MYDGYQEFFYSISIFLTVIVPSDSCIESILFLLKLVVDLIILLSFDLIILNPRFKFRDGLYEDIILIILVKALFLAF